jgi:hypothetical protein
MKAFLVNLPIDLYNQAKKLSQHEGPPMSFLVREGLRLALEKRRRKEKVKNC